MKTLHDAEEFSGPKLMRPLGPLALLVVSSVILLLSAVVVEIIHRREIRNVQTVFIHMKRAGTRNSNGLCRVSQRLVCCSRVLVVCEIK